MPDLDGARAALSLRHGTGVGTGGERLVAAGNDDGADVVIIVKRQQGCADFIHQAIVEGVELLGAIERDDADAVAAFDKDEFAGHAASPHALGFNHAKALRDKRAVNQRAAA